MYTVLCFVKTDGQTFIMSSIYRYGIAPLLHSVEKACLEGRAAEVEKSEVALLGAEQGSIRLLEWSGLTPDAFLAAVRHGHVHVLEWAKQRDELISKFSSGNVFKNAVRSNGIAMVKWLLEEGGYIFNRRMVDWAAELGHRELVTWLVEERKVNINEWTTRAAAASGDVELMQYLRSQGCAWDFKTMSEAARHQDLDMLDWCFRRQCPINRVDLIATAASHLRIVQWCYDNGITGDESTYVRAAHEKDAAAVIRFLWSKGCPADASACAAVAAHANHFELLQWMHQQGFPWDERTAKTLATFTDVRYLEWAVQQGCPFDAHCLDYFVHFHNDMRNLGDWLPIMIDTVKRRQSRDKNENVH